MRDIPYAEKEPMRRVYYTQPPYNQFTVYEEE
jgi:hypothetical protein